MANISPDLEPAAPAEGFLATWTKDFLAADPLDRGSDFNAAAECTADAAHHGISIEQLVTAAGGNLSEHLGQVVESTRALAT